ncbi:hypothetical protein [Leptospira meyeri]|uniref:hypothetical protein n=1 Tax=Leptospira meyeri TaxID=29508 RepID=UPI00223CFE43|nr:hypothetical protein [Leptospira meyeri]MCW7490886.1 hypothetical protein [Leptospira meyeri]
MNALSKKSKEIQYNFLNGNYTLKDIEPFLFESKEIESNFDYNDYIDLLSINFNKNENRYNAITLIEKNINMKEYETWRINRIFNNIIEKGDNYSDSIELLYNLYCKGYYFLEKLGLKYGLVLSYPKEHNFNKNIAELSKKEQKNLSDKLYPEIITEVEFIKNLITTNKIILTGKLNENNYYMYIDNMNEEERERVQFYENKKKKENRFWNFLRKIIKIN